MIRKTVFSALLIALCGIASCDDGGGNNGSSNSSSHTITAFSFTSADNPGLSADVPGTITGASIAATVPYGTTVTALKATFTTTGTSVTIGTTEQTSGTTANDFTSAKTYTVTAADSSTQDYAVTVTVASNSAKEITAFSFPAVTFLTDVYNQSGSPINKYGTTISGTSITVRLPYGSSSMVAAFATTGASVSVGGVTQTSGVTSNDFTNPVTYRVTAANGSTQDYTVTVLFVPAVNSVWNTSQGGVLSSYWVAYASTTTDTDETSLTLTCDAINAGSDTFTMEIFTTCGHFNRHAPGSSLGSPYLTVPSDTTVTDNTVADNDDERYLEIVGPLASIQSVIVQLAYIPPESATTEGLLYMRLTDKNGLVALGRTYITVIDPY